jgi:hypothetical protein
MDPVRQSYLLGLGLWTLDEAVHLVNGLDPDAPPPPEGPRVKPRSDSIKDQLDAMYAPFRLQIEQKQLLEKTRRDFYDALALNKLQLIAGKLRPAEVLEWAHSLGDRYPDCPRLPSALVQRPQTKPEQHRKMIMAALQDLGYDPMHLPPKEKLGKRWVRAEVRERLGNSITISQFRKAWQALFKGGLKAEEES